MRSETKARGAEYAGPRSPVRVMQVVEALAEASEGLSLAALSVQLEIPKTSLLNHLRVLAVSGHVALQGSRYTLGPAAIRLGAMIAAGTHPLAALRAVAQRLATRSGETTLVAMLDAGTREAVYLEVLEGRQPIRYSPAVGTRRPLYCTAMGRALLAAQDPAWIRAYLSTAPFKRYNARTIVDRAKLSRTLVQISREGVAVTLEEHTDGVGAVASPIRNGNGNADHAIGIAVPIARLAPRKQPLSEMVRAAAEEASWTLGAAKA